MNMLSKKEQWRKTQSEVEMKLYCTVDFLVDVWICREYVLLPLRSLTAACNEMLTGSHNSSSCRAHIIRPSPSFHVTSLWSHSSFSLHHPPSSSFISLSLHSSFCSRALHSFTLSLSLSFKTNLYLHEWKRGDSQSIAFSKHILVLVNCVGGTTQGEITQWGDPCEKKKLWSPIQPNPVLPSPSYSVIVWLDCMLNMINYLYNLGMCILNTDIAPKFKVKVCNTVSESQNPELQFALNASLAKFSNLYWH